MQVGPIFSRGDQNFQEKMVRPDQYSGNFGLPDQFFRRTKISVTVQALTLILARNGCSSQRAASQSHSVFIASNSPWSVKAIHNTLWLLFVVKDAIFKFVRMRTRSLVPKPNTTVTGLGNEPRARWHGLFP